MGEQNLKIIIFGNNTGATRKIGEAASHFTNEQLASGLQALGHNVWVALTMDSLMEKMLVEADYIFVNEKISDAEGRDIQLLAGNLKPAPMIVTLSALFNDEELKDVDNWADITLEKRGIREVSEALCGHSGNDGASKNQCIEEDGSQTRCLVVDDEEQIRIFLKALLTRKGYLVELADSGDTAVEMVKDNNYSFVLMDIHMPGKDGITALKEIKKLKPELIVVMMTGYENCETIQSIIDDALAEHCLKKPFHPESLVRLIEMFRERRDLDIQYQIRAKNEESFLMRKLHIEMKSYNRRFAIFVIIFSLLIGLLMLYSLDRTIILSTTSEKKVEQMFEVVTGYLERDEQRKIEESF